MFHDGWRSRRRRGRRRAARRRRRRAGRIARRARSARLAAAVIEPLIQGAAGMRLWPAGHAAKTARVVRPARRPAHRRRGDDRLRPHGHDVRLRAGGRLPDFLCLAKGLTGGYLPLAATLTTERVYEAFLGEYRERKTFFYGHSYTANALGCAAALASLAIFREEDVLARLRGKIDRLAHLLEARLAPLAHVAEIRQCGFIAGIELMADPAKGEPFPVGGADRRAGVRGGAGARTADAAHRRHAGAHAAVLHHRGRTGARRPGAWQRHPSGVAAGEPPQMNASGHRVRQEAALAGQPHARAGGLEQAQRLELGHLLAPRGQIGRAHAAVRPQPEGNRLRAPQSPPGLPHGNPRPIRRRGRGHCNAPCRARSPIASCPRSKTRSDPGRGNRLPPNRRDCARTRGRAGRNWRSRKARTRAASVSAVMLEELGVGFHVLASSPAAKRRKNSVSSS